MSIITNYAIIDHVGSLTEKENKKIYTETYTAAKKLGVDTTITLKKVCLMDSPFAREVTNKMKLRIRYTKNPRIVYLICNNENEQNVKYVRKIWEDRGIEVKTMEVHPFEENRDFDYGQEQSDNRKIAEIWAEALGYTFSAPLHRDQRVNDIDSYQARPDEEIMRARVGSHITKIIKANDKFCDARTTIAPESEVNEFIKFYNALVEQNLINEMMDPDWEICPHCGKPIKVRQESQAQCRFCDYVVESEIVFERYFDETLDEFED